METKPLALRLNPDPKCKKQGSRVIKKDPRRGEVVSDSAGGRRSREKAGVFTGGRRLRQASKAPGLMWVSSLRRRRREPRKVTGGHEHQVL